MDAVLLALAQREGDACRNVSGKRCVVYSEKSFQIRMMSVMREKFAFGQVHWLKVGIGVVVFLVVVSIVLRILAFLLPLVILGALVFFGIKLVAQNGSDRERWEAWGKQFGERAERWGKQFERQVQSWSGRGAETAEAEPKHKNEAKRKNDEDVLEIEYAEPLPERGKAKRHADEESYL